MPGAPNTLAEFWEEYTREAVEQVMRQGRIDGVLIKQHTHPAFYGHITEMARNAQLSYTPRVIVAKEIAAGPLWARKLPNAGASPLRSVILTEEMMRLTNSSVNRRMSAELETVMAHEFSHLKDGAGLILQTHIQPFALPLVAMLGLRLYDMAQAKTPKDPRNSKKDHCERLTQSLHEVANKEIERCHSEKATENWTPEPQWQAYLINAARYAMAGAIAFAAGLAISRHQSLSAEYRADKFAVETTGNPEAFKNVLRKLTDIYKAARRETPPADTLGGQVKEAFHHLMADTIGAHPTVKQRVNYIDMLAKQRQHAPAIATIL